MSGNAKTFGDQDIAQKTRDVIRKIVSKMLDAERPVYKYGVVQSVNYTASTCSVIPHGQTGPVTYPFYGCWPVVGANVMIAGLSGDRFVATVVAPPGAAPAILTGTQGRYVGQTNGAPASGPTYAVGDFANDPTNHCFWVCTAITPSLTWNQVGGSPLDSSVGSASSLTTGLAQLSTRATLVVPAGTWVLVGTVLWDVSPSAAVVLSAQFFDGAGTTYGQVFNASAPVAAETQKSAMPMLSQRVILATSKTIDIRAKTSATGGTQLIDQAFFTAIPAS